MANPLAPRFGGRFGSRRYATHVKNPDKVDRRVGVVVRVRQNASPAEVFAAALPEILAGRVTVSEGIGRPPGRRSTRDPFRDVRFAAAQPQQQAVTQPAAAAAPRPAASRPAAPRAFVGGATTRTSANPPQVPAYPQFPGTGVLEGQERLRALRTPRVLPQAGPSALTKGVSSRVQTRAQLSSRPGFLAYVRDQLTGALPDDRAPRQALAQARERYATGERQAAAGVLPNTSVDRLRRNVAQAETRLRAVEEARRSGRRAIRDTLKVIEMQFDAPMGTFLPVVR